MSNSMNVYQKLNVCRVALQSSELKKSGNNKFAGYSYFELGDFLPTINRLFAENGLCSVVRFDKEIAELRVVNTDDPQQVIIFTSPMADANLKGCHPIQNLGAVQTYSRRYLYLAALEIVEHDAVDAGNPVSKKGATPAEKFADTASAKGVTPTAGAMEHMDDAERKFISEFAEGIQQHFNDGTATPAELVSMLEERHLDAEEKVAVWSLLDSKVRSAIKKANETAKIADSIAGQA